MFGNQWRFGVSNMFESAVGSIFEFKCSSIDEGNFLPFVYRLLVAPATQLK